ncbi:Hydroxyacylglutathione hydrolase [Baekduia alba]|uniref:MBL fold metallo-hydrolase n=1 Tax=Baekduia alba TaxID=2997333 RepID=UPI0023413B4B|nr:MBL fold metallo-hydrolase [Baekduia alba]WCB93214.1 Hydroxyacylglutathione hydrolase [Baekduia alba]
MSSHREIDVHFQGAAKAVCTHQIDGYVVDPGPESSVGAVFAALGDERPEAVLLTHIHLDHAGAAGALVERWPGLEVWVHRNGARHVIDPSRLVASAQRIYGDQMERLWGRIVPVPEANVRILDDGGRAGGLEWAWTPGHAVHHVAYLHEDTNIVFAGDVAGVRIGDGPILPPTPPPDIDVEAWHASIDRVAAWEPSALAITHFGTFTDVARHLESLHAELDRWAGVARDHDASGFEREIRAALAGTADEHGYLKAMPPETLYGGLARYWKKRDTAAS